MADNLIDWSVFGSRRPQADSHEYEVWQRAQEAQAKGIKTLEDAKAWGYTPGGIEALYPHRVGTQVSQADYLQSMQGFDPRPYIETQNMNLGQFTNSPYSTYTPNADGSLTYRGLESGWKSPTPIPNENDAGSGGLKRFLKVAGPPLLAFTGLGAALGGLSGMGIPGLFGGETAAAGSTVAGGAGGLPDSYWSMVAGGGDAAQAEALAAATQGVGGVPYAGDPFIDAWTSYGTGGGPTGLPLPGSAGAGAGAGMNWLDAGRLASGASNFVSNGGPGMPQPTEPPAAPWGNGPSPAPGLTTDTDWMNILPGLGSGIGGAAANWGGSGAATPASSLAQALKTLTGGAIDLAPGLMSGLGNLLSTGLGAYGANQNANALENIANQARADRQPFLDSALDMLKNPGSFYERPEVMGAVDASLRGLSSKVGNPINNPGALAQQAAYNTGLYNQALTSRANLGLGGQDLTSRLQTNAAMANNGIYNALGSGLGSMFSNQPDMNALAAQLLLR